MKLMTQAPAIAVTLFAAAIVPDFSAAQNANALLPPTKIRIEYQQPKNPELAKVQQRLKDRHVLETLQEFLSALRLPRELLVRTAQCGEGNQSRERLGYAPGGPVTICYELMQKIEIFAARHTNDQAMQQKVVVGGFVQAALHETAYAIFDILEVPVWGRQFDAADKLAALIIMQFGDDVAQTVMVGTANLFFWSDQTWQGSQFASAASPDAQRFYNYACIAVAANPILFGNWAERGLIPVTRAGPHGAWCEGEYAEIRKAFNLRIMPYVDADALVRLRSTNWLAWAPGK